MIDDDAMSELDAVLADADRLDLLDFVREMKFVIESQARAISRLEEEREWVASQGGVSSDAFAKVVARSRRLIDRTAGLADKVRAMPGDRVTVNRIADMIEESVR